MIRGRRAKAPPWSSEEIAILIDVYPRGGLDEASDALPERSWGALTMMASKLGLRSALFGQGRVASLAGEPLEAAILEREDLGWSFERIGKAHGVCETAAQNAVLIALCPRKGFSPAERDANGKLLPDGRERLRVMLRQGRKGVDISLELGISVARIAMERREMNADLVGKGHAALPPPGNGERYSGAKIAGDVHAQVDALLMQGYGAPRIAEWTTVSKTHVQRRRLKLVRRLARRGECLAGCDAAGKRIAYKDSAAAVAEVQKDILRAELMKGTPVARAAKIAVIGASYAYDYRDQLQAELARAGRTLPPIKRLGRKAEAIDRALDWLPRKKKNLILYRRFLIEAGGDQDEAKRRTIAVLMPKPVAVPKVKRIYTFEEQLERVARGEVGLVANIPLRRPGYAGTLGGIASAAL